MRDVFGNEMSKEAEDMINAIASLFKSEGIGISIYEKQKKESEHEKTQSE